MKKLKLRIAKFDRMLVVEQLELEGKIRSTAHIKAWDNLGILTGSIFLRESSIKHKSSDCLRFDNDTERDAYLQKVLGWITDELFGGARKLEIGKECLVSDDGEGWSERIYAGKVAKQLGMDKRYLTHSESEEDVFLRWRYAKPINDSLKIDDEIYTWENKQ